MSKKMKGLFLFLIVLLLVYITGESIDLGWDPALQKAPVYVALGDSVAYGMSATEGLGYNDRFSVYLQRNRYRDRFPVDFRNLSHPGDTAEELYQLVKTEEYASALGEADIITINIGGNHLLQSLLNTVYSVYPEASAASGGLQDAILRNPWAILRLVVGLQNPVSPESDALNRSLGIAVSTFESYWPRIMNELTILAPDAEIYVNTVYSPVTREEPLYGLIDPYVSKINVALEAYGNQYRYTLVDVYRAFERVDSDVVEFNLVGSPVRADFHPNDEGHAVIFETLKTAMENREPY
ncbi:MAG TPA: GDSL-type esterase/lipase family protein [Clostridiaceae bacterium]|nr:GDSL-type esterase/lipase family protein [Clostridiaceae bacterium]